MGVAMYLVPGMLTPKVQENLYVANGAPKTPQTYFNDKYSRP